MKGKVAIAVLLVSVLLLNSCTAGDRKMFFDNSDKQADARMEQILNALENKDFDALKSLFSEKAINEADNFDGSVEYLFGFFQGNVVSWERDGFGSEELVDYGKKSIKLWSWYTITTDNEVYMVFVSDYVVDTITPENAGIYTFRMIRAVDETTGFAGTWQDMENPGIYVPKK